jgi:hypothetical protein
VTAFVVTLGFGLPESCRIASRGFCWLHLRFDVGIATLGVATIGARFPTSCPVASQSSLLLNMASFVGVTTIGVATRGIIFPTSCPMASRGSIVPNMASCGASWRKSRRSASVFVTSGGSHTLIMASFRGVATLGFGFPTSCPIVSRYSSAKYCLVAASRPSASVLLLRVRWYPEAHLCQEWRLVGASRRKSSRRPTSIYQRRGEWYPEAHLR